MDLFLLLLNKILPLYLMIGFGFFAGQKLKVERETVATLMVYLLGPVIFFGATAQMRLDKEFLLLPVMVFLICCLLGLGFYNIACRFWKDGRRNIAGYAMGTANQAYFGIPVFLALFGEENLGLYILAGLGITFYEGTIGYYMMARGRYSAKESFQKLLRLPLIPAVLAGLAFSAIGGHLPDAAKEFYTVFKGAYTVFGMMIIGLGLSSLHHLKADVKFTSFILFGKFVCWPAVTFAFLRGYELLMGPAQPLVREIIVLISLMPIAANTVAFATQLKVEPEKAATIVFLSTAIALFYIPLVLGWVM